MRESRRLAEVQTPVIPVVGDLVRSTPGTISLGQGVVGYGPPREAVEAAARFGGQVEDHKYKAVEGIPPLLEALAAKLKAENGIPAAGRRIVVTAGGNMAFLNAVLAVADVGDEVVLQAPYYFNHEMAIGMLGCRTVVVDTGEDLQLRPDAIAKAITPRTRAVVTVSPNNPSGMVYPEAALREVNALCRERGVYHVHDEAYEYFTYGVPHFSPGSIAGGEEHTISLYSLSKAYGFASWRIGWMVIPAHLFEAVRKIQDTNLICPAVVSQVAAVAALGVGAGYARERLKPLAEVREIALRELGKVVSFPRPDGAFYAFLRLDSDLKPLALVERLIREHKVAVIPGDAFGMTKGCTVRVAFGALEKATAAEGIGRLVRGLKEILG
jgi:aspartate/methionine/tyrosine aminotransferase